jgi:nucleotidyltransferase substrate binding protein (TIGR01987 family)
MNIQMIINQVVKIILKNANPDRIYLYGSRVTGEAKDTSDIDIAYDDKDAKSHYKILDEVENIATLVKIDIKNIAFSENRFKNRVRSTGKVLYSASKKLRAEDGLYNFSNALKRFNEALEKRNTLKKEGFEDIILDLIVKRFEFTYEMSWKALKRYLDYNGIEAQYPRELFKEAYTLGLIENQYVWLDMIEMRNLSSHIYNEYEIEAILDKVDDYAKEFINLQEKIKDALK